MKKTILEVYAFAVCFFAVACFAVALGFFLYGVVGITNPEFTLDFWEYTRHQSNDQFWGESEESDVTVSRPPMIMPGGRERVRPVEADLTKKRLASYARAMASERRGNTQTVVKSAIVMLIDVLVFSLHWRIARREDKNVA